MEHSEFFIGKEFFSGSGRRWRCTDVGSRVVTAIDLSQYPDDPSWYNGPPYAVVESVFDENDFPGLHESEDDLRESQEDVAPLKFYLKVPRENQPKPGTCDLPPEGWYCNLEHGHQGPCPTWPA